MSNGKTAPPDTANLEAVLDFCVDLSRRMIVSGANIERVQLAIERITYAYGLKDVSVHLLSTFLSIGARDAQGRYAFRQGSIPPAGIHLERLKRLNRLSYAVVGKKPSPLGLPAVLEEASWVVDYPDWLILLAQCLALSCLCLIFGGGPLEILPVLAVTALIHYGVLLLARLGLDHIVSNAVVMFAASVLSLLYLHTGVPAQGPVIFITVSMLMIPGIPLVNAVRNLLCGNEMNGILQLSKVTIETMALAMGIYTAVMALGHGAEAENAVVVTLSDPVLLVLLSFLASVGFGMVFRIPVRDLWKGGLGGALTRVVLLSIQTVTGTRILFVTVAALCAALYAEALATRQRDPSTYFVYPAIVPLIPGDLFYYAIVGLYTSDRAMFERNALDCLVALLGMSIGFVLSSIIAHYIRRGSHRKKVEREQGAAAH